MGVVIFHEVAILELGPAECELKASGSRTKNHDFSEDRVAVCGTRADNLEDVVPRAVKHIAHRFYGVRPQAALEVQRASVVQAFDDLESGKFGYLDDISAGSSR